MWLVDLQFMWGHKVAAEQISVLVQARPHPLAGTLRRKMAKVQQKSAQHTHYVMYYAQDKATVILLGLWSPQHAIYSAFVQT